MADIDISHGGFHFHGYSLLLDGKLFIGRWGFDVWHGVVGDMRFIVEANNLRDENTGKTLISMGGCDLKGFMPSEKVTIEAFGIIKSINPTIYTGQRDYWIEYTFTIDLYDLRVRRYD